MKNKKGFTLVELLAVIVILGVLLLIAVPSITKVIENSRKSSYESSVKMMIENVETMASLASNPTTCYVDIANIDLDRGQKEGAGYIVYNALTRKGTAYTYSTDRKYYVNGDTSVDLNAEVYTGNDAYKFEISNVAATCSDTTYATESTCTAAGKMWTPASNNLMFIEGANSPVISVSNLAVCSWY